MLSTDIYYITGDGRIRLINAELDENNLIANISTMLNAITEHGGEYHLDDWRFISACPNNPDIHYRIQNENSHILYSQSRKCILEINKGYAPRKAKSYNNKMEYILMAQPAEYQNIKYAINNIDLIYFNPKYKGSYIISDYTNDGLRYCIEHIDDIIYNSMPENEAYVSLKQEAKNKAKEKIHKKYKLGAHYYLRSKSVEGSEQDIKEFILKKFVYSINDTEVNSLILKQIGGINNAIFTLNKCDCAKLHIKYEPGLQVFSMLNNFILKNENYN